MYAHEILEFEDPVFTFPVSYLITLHDSPRRAHYMEELRRTRPTRTVIVLHNPGKQHKPEVTSTRADIWHANCEVFRATQHLASPVLIMEDDVEFAPREKLLASAGHIERVLVHATEVYFLGCMPIAALPMRHDLCLGLAGAAHAVVYSARARQRIWSMDMVGLHDVMVSAITKCRTPRVPLAVQPHPLTDNAKEWGKFCYWYLRLQSADTRAWQFYKRHHAFGHIGGFAGALVLLTLAATLTGQRLLAAHVCDP